MKVKDLHFDIAKKRCNEHLEKNNYSECACADCPLWLNNCKFCARDFAWMNYKYGNIEIDLKEKKSNES